MHKKSSRLVKADFEALSEFRYQLRRFLRFSEDAARSEGLLPQQYQLLLHVKGFPGRDWATIGELAERLQVQQHGVVALVSRCEAAGLIVRAADEADRRKVQVRLSADGEKRLRRLAERHRTELLSLSKVIGVAHISTLGEMRRSAED
jgi:DNA-binding MarR family transcriptional regulator